MSDRFINLIINSQFNGTIFQILHLVDRHGISNLEWNSSTHCITVILIGAFDFIYTKTYDRIIAIECIHSIQGYDLNYAFVILGNDIGYDKTAGKIIVHPECYYDKNGKRTASYDELLEYITNVYYVLMTRGIKGTYLYVCDDELREYLSQYIEMEE